MSTRKKKKDNNIFRFFPLTELPLSNGAKIDYRTEFDRDYARVLHSPTFRRLQNKTQLFPGQESDFFRNRLTHSLEVSQIAKSIACKLKSENPALDVSPQVCEIAGLVHDIGHPPFGHNGEAALDACMRSFGGFEGNAQTLHILTRLEKKEPPIDGVVTDGRDKDFRFGLNLTARVIASSLKYDCAIPRVRDKDAPLVKGYYFWEEPVVSKLKELLAKGQKFSPTHPFKSIECAIMDLADDIAYSTYDVEDAFKADFLTPYDMISASDSIYREIVRKLESGGIHTSIEECRTSLIGVFSEVWTESIQKQRELSNSPDAPTFETETIANFLSAYRASKRIASDGYFRTKLTSGIVNLFINGVKVDLNNDCPILSHVYFDKETMLRVNILKHFSYVALINSPRLKVAENRGKEIITKMFKKLSEKGGHVLLPQDMKELFLLSPDELWRKRVVCDFIAGMTDRYAVEFYGRLFSENPQSIFKPLY